MPLLVDPCFVYRKQVVLPPIINNAPHNLAICSFHGFISGKRNGIPRVYSTVKKRIDPHLVKPIRFWMKLVIWQFMLYPQKDQYAASYPYRQTGNVDKRINAVFKQVSDCDSQVVSKHKDGLKIGYLPNSKRLSLNLKYFYSWFTIDFQRAKGLHTGRHVLLTCRNDDSYRRTKAGSACLL